MRCSFTLLVSAVMVTKLIAQFDNIGGLKTLFIGHWMSLSMRMNVGFVLCTAHRILRMLRRIALNALERETSFRRSIRQKSRLAAMNDQYMVSVLAAAVSNSSPILGSACQ